MAAERYDRVSESSKNFSQMLENNFVGIADVKSFTAEPEEVRRLSECDLRLSEYSMDAGAVSSRQSAFTGSAFSLGYVVTAGYAGLMTTTGKISVSDYIRIFYWFPLLLEALTDIEQIAKLFYSASNAAKQLAEVLESQPGIRGGPVTLPEGRSRGEVSFENVTFGYDPSVEVLSNVSFRVRPGETLAIVGSTGSGKSTLFRLLVRFFDVQSGRILLDGTDIRELDLRQLRQSVSLVSQDVHLFQGSVRQRRLRAARRARSGVVERRARRASGEHAEGNARWLGHSRRGARAEAFGGRKTARGDCPRAPQAAPRRVHPRAGRSDLTPRQQDGIRLQKESRQDRVEQERDHDRPQLPPSSRQVLCRKWRSSRRRIRRALPAKDSTPRSVNFRTAGRGGGNKGACR